MTEPAIERDAQAEQRQPADPAIEALVHGRHGAPRRLLGVLAAGDRFVVRVFRPGAMTVSILDPDGRSRLLERVHDAGLFEAVLAQRPEGHVQLAVDGGVPQYDPYDFPLLLGSLDLHLFNEGTERRAYEHFGAHPRVIDGIAGVHFAVWAPNARRLSVIGDFNQWNPVACPLEQRESSGIWEIFVPGLEVGTAYKFSILPANGGEAVEKADPYALQSELRPKSASIVAAPNRYVWNDDEWIRERPERQAFEAPIVIYEVHLGSWRRTDDPEQPFLNYRVLAHQLANYVKRLGFTHVELLPIAEHPLDASWGYQVIGYFAPTSRFGSPDDFRYFVDYLHQQGIGVILDWVPGHFPRDGHGLSSFDGTDLYSHHDPRLGEQPEWGTRVFNFGRHEVRSFLLSNALYWLDQFHIDGLRVDAVASMLYLDYSRRPDAWLPNRYGGRENLEAIDFLRRLNEVIHGEYPGVLTIAEESTAWPLVSRPTYDGGLGFSFKWNMGWMHDTLSFLGNDPLFRRYHQGAVTFSLLYAFSENFVLPLSHDEVVHGKGSLIGKMPGDWWQQFANLRLLLGYQYGHPGKKLLFMGGELAQWSEWSESRPLDWALLDWPMHRGMSRYVTDLNRLYREESALHEVDSEFAGFHWVDFNDTEQSVIVFRRLARDPDDWLLILLNFTPEPRHRYRIGVPEPGRYRELLNSDSEIYGGSNIGNLGGVTADPIRSHGFDWSIRLTLPPLAMIVLKPD